MLQEKLDQSGIPFVAIREPGGTTIGENIRQILLQRDYSISLQAELLLYLAARAELVEQVIRPALQNKLVVLCDRFTDSTLAYQGYGGGMSLDWVRYLNCKATGGLFPRITLLLDLDVDAAIKRRGTAGDRVEDKDLYFHRRVRNGYLELASMEPQRIIIVDASASAEKQHQTIWHLVGKLIDGREGMGL